MQNCWAGSDNLKSFERSLEERGFFLAKGDKRGHVVIDHAGEIHSLPRVLGLKTKDVRERLGTGDDLRGVAETKRSIAQRMTPAIRRHVEESRAQFQKRSATLGHYKMEMTHLHRAARTKLEARLDAEWLTQTKARTDRLPKGLRGLWHRITGKYQEVRGFNEAEAKASRERQALERQKLVEKQQEQRAVLQVEFKELRKRQAGQLLELRTEIGRYLKFTRGEEPGKSIGRDPALGLKLER